VERPIQRGELLNQESQGAEKVRSEGESKLGVRGVSKGGFRGRRRAAEGLLISVAGESFRDRRGGARAGGKSGGRVTDNVGVRFGSFSKILRPARGGWVRGDGVS